MIQKKLVTSWKLVQSWLTFYAINPYFYVICCCAIPSINSILLVFVYYAMRFPICCEDINQENISKNYLQDLFGSFPHNGGNQDAENSEGEYHIYDQYSDGNESDDDY